MKSIKIMLLFLVATVLSVSLVYAAPPQGQWTAKTYQDDAGLVWYWTHGFCFNADGTWYSTTLSLSGEYYKKGLSDKIHIAAFNGYSQNWTGTLELIRYGLMAGKMRYDNPVRWLQVEFVRTGDVCGPAAYSMPVNSCSPGEDCTLQGQ